MKYLLKQNKEDKGILCDKVTLNEFDYYVNTNHKSSKGYYLTENRFLVLILKEHAHSEMFSYEGQIVSTGVYVNFINIDKFSKVIATNNPNIDIPKVRDEVEMLASNIISCSINIDIQLIKEVWKAGYNKSQETHSFSEENMAEFGKFCGEYGSQLTKDSNIWLNHFTDEEKTTQELLQLWKEQQPKIIYYNG